MSKMTDRTPNQHLIELAKQNYESNKRSILPSNEVKLASAGKIYPADSPLRKGTVSMRYMTAYDEDILTNTTYIRDGILFDKLLESIITEPGVTVGDISVSDRDSLIVAARISGYGAEYPIQVTDPNTNKPIEHVLDLSKIPFKQFNLIPDENGEFDYTMPVSKIAIKFKYLTSAESQQIKAENALSKIVELSITEINGDRDRSKIEEFVRYHLIAGDSRKFRNHMIDNAPGLELNNITIEGENGSTFSTGFQIGPDLFWF